MISKLSRIALALLLVVQTVSADVSTIDLSGCGTSMGCYIPSQKECMGKPDGLTFTYSRVNESYFHFQLLGKASTDGFNDFVAVGFSYDKLMGNESVLECSSLGANAPISLKFSWNDDEPRNVRIDGEEDIRDNYISSKAQYSNGMMYCDGLVKVSGDANIPEIFNYDPSQKYYILLAIGVANAKGTIGHSVSCVSPMAVDLSSYPVQNNFDTSTCGKDKACYMPTDKNGMAFSYKLLSQSKMQVEFTSLMAQPNQYVAVGFSLDNMMGNDTVIECSSIDGVDKAGVFSIKYSYNNYNEKNRPDNERLVYDKSLPLVTNFKSVAQDGELYCTGIIDITGTANPLMLTFDNVTNYFLLMASGETTAGGLMSHHHNDAVSSVMFNMATVQPLAVPTTPAPPTLDLSNCGISMGCYVPAEQDCNNGAIDGLTVTYTQLNDSYFHFQLIGKPTTADNSFIAVGFSNDVMMGNESVLECSSLGSNAPVSFKFSYNNANPTNVRIDGESTIRANYITDTSKYTDGLLYCDGVVKVSGDPARPQIFKWDPSAKYHLLLAMGVADANGLKGHRTGTTCRSPIAIDLASVQNNFDTSTCGMDKACFMPTDTNGMAFSYKLLSQSKMQVEFKSIMALTNQYVAVGFSLDNMMGNDTVIECSSIDGIDKAGEFSIKYSYNIYRDNGRPTNQRLVYNNSLPLVTDFSSKAQDGELYCTGIIDITGNANPLMLTYNNVTDYYLLMASGNTTTGGLSYHYDNKIVSGSLYNMASVQPIEVPITPAPTVNTNSTMDVSNCGISMGCYVPAAQDCNNGAIDGLTVTYTKLNDSYFHFQLIGKPTTADNSFIAVGFSNDVMMGNESVLECSSLGSNASVSFKFSYNNANPTNVRIDGEQTIRANYITDTSKYTDGLLYCDGVVKVSGDPTRPQIFKWDPSAKYHLLLAMGVADANGLKGHRTGTTCRSPIAIDLASVQNNFDTSTCGKDKACFLPTDTNGMAFSYKLMSQSKMQVEFKSIMTLTNQYVAVGFSLDNKMGNDTVIECSSIDGIDKAGEFSIKYSYNIYRDNGRPTNQRLVYNNSLPLVTDFSSKAQDGELYCTGIIDITGTANPLMLTYNNATDYYLLMASGNTTTGGLSYHYDNKVVSGSLYNMASVQPIPAPTTTPASNADFDCSQCSVTKSCFFQGGTSCSGYGVAWRMVDEKNMKLELINPGTEQYIAVGFGTGNTMGGSNVIECSSIGTDPYSMKFSYNNESPRNVRIDGEEKIESTYFVGTSIKSEDGRLYCKTKVNVAGWDGSGQVFKWDSNQNYYVLIAKGPTTGSGLNYHTSRQISPKAVKLDSVGSLTSSTPPLILVHAILMILAWICFIPTALLFARFLRNSWPMYKPGGLLIWFHVHRTCNMLGICMMIASFVCIMFQNKWKWSGPGSNEPKWQKVHTMVGLIALVLAWLQPFISTMRCSPNDQRRPIFNWIHRGIGTIAFILAITAMAIAGDQFTGIWSNNGVQLGLILAALGVVVVMCCIFPILDHLESRKTTDHKSWERLRQLFVLIALLFLFGDGIALSVLVGVGKPAM